MIIKYRADMMTGFPRIEKVAVESETEKTMKSFSGSRIQKSTDLISYFDTFEDAKKSLIDSIEKTILEKSDDIFRLRNKLILAKQLEVVK